jgi:hypothetical protein
MKNALVLIAIPLKLLDFQCFSSVYFSLYCKIFMKIFINKYQHNSAPVIKNLFGKQS